VEALLIDILLGFAIGLTLGFLGGGGSILTVPALVYVVGQSPQAAVTAALVIVGANAAMGAFFHRRQSALNWPVALLFGGAGMATAYLAADLSHQVPPAALLSLFALLMLVVGGFMVLSRASTQCDCTRGWWATIASGAGVGFLTGFLGVGGGFLIVPALVMLVGLPMRQAVGTSLVVIAMNSLAGLLGHLANSVPDFSGAGVIVIFVLTGLAGVFSGAKMTRFICPDHLRTTFAIFVMLLGVALLIDNVSKLM
jgi:uncharacterized membrane protein YfcA